MRFVPKVHYCLDQIIPAGTSWQNSIEGVFLVSRIRMAGGGHGSGDMMRSMEPSLSAFPFRLRLDS